MHNVYIYIYSTVYKYIAVGESKPEDLDHCCISPKKPMTVRGDLAPMNCHCMHLS